MSIDFNGETQRRRNGDFGIGKLAKIWPLLVAIFLAITAWAYLNADVKDHSKRIAKIEDKIEDIPIIAANVQRLLDLAQADEKRRRWREDRDSNSRGSHQ